MDPSKIHTDRVALHFCDVMLRAKKPLPAGYPQTLDTIGDNLRKKRLDLNLYQRDIAKLIGVNTNSVTNWEKNKSSPRLYLLPKVIDFPGYNPIETCALGLGERIKQERVQNGLSLRKLAKNIGVDPGTLARWERGDRLRRGAPKKRITRLLGLS